MHILYTHVRLYVVLTRKELLLRVGKYEPHNFRQFGNEQSLVVVRDQ